VLREEGEQSDTLGEGGTVSVVGEREGESAMGESEVVMAINYWGKDQAR
jgi:hypothetical protein